MIEFYDKSKLFMTAVEVMMRAYFGAVRDEAENRSVKKEQEAVTKRFMRYIGGEAEEHAFARAEISIFSKDGISPIWLSRRFTLTPIALLAHNYLSALTPPPSRFFEVDVSRDDRAFFGFQAYSIRSSRDDDAANHLVTLAAIASAKAIMSQPNTLQIAMAEGERLAR